jgi:hypothetical protein
VEEGRLRGFQLAMTRALGHRLLSGYGVSAEPSGAVGFPLWWGMGVGRSWHGVGWLQCRAAEMVLLASGWLHWVANNPSLLLRLLRMLPGVLFVVQ